ncbi:hypothetical protein CA13_26470 [Planctomycetes bacterium CA13]|uniref:Uncharacterized protein n=1 Tax=Novipirellula herctigrandis TaxID=2527986 RepID=A0A5C5Z1E5_9BACT|nr:hypothetical protein CA13_26470 [Planctomycetes bacterium CA13]
MINALQSECAATAPKQYTPALTYNQDKLDELRRLAEGTVWRAIAYSNHADVRNGQLFVDGGRADEMQIRLTRYNNVHDGHRLSLAAFYFARMFGGASE